jgi:CubicO group peptidase (beta-lactamase class C family)
VPRADLTRGLVSVALLFFLLAASRARAAEPDRVDALVEAERARQHIPGVGIAIVRGGEVAKLAGYGLANVERQVPVKPETILQSGSLGQPGAGRTRASPTRSRRSSTRHSRGPNSRSG